DIPIIRELYNDGLVNKNTFVICNGYKRPLYIKYISELINEGFQNVIPILDHMGELKEIEKQVKGNFKVGIRIASEEEPTFEFYTSRLGIRYKDIVDYYEKEIKNNKRVELKMLHF